MAILKTTALCSLALAAMVLPEQADAHAFLLLPKTEFTTDKKNFYAYVVPGKSVPPENAYFTGDAEKNSKGFTKNYAAGNWKNLKEFIFKLQQPSGPYEDRPAGGTAECGFSIPTAKAQPLPDKLEYGNYALTISGGFHPGPCEAWCDDEIVVPLTPDCRVFLGKRIDYAKDKCVGKSRLTFYWVATHFAPFQVYTSCVPLQGAVAGGGGGGGSTATNTTTAAPATTTAAPKATTAAPKATTAAPKATTAAPKATTAAPAAATPAPKAASDADQTVKCKVKGN